jgi:delta1-piperideine-2-carboxylate reductase
MRVSVHDARELVCRAMRALGYNATESETTADHLLDCELRGLAYGGLARAISIAERVGRKGRAARPVCVLHETPVSARIDGGDNIGYVVARRATEIAISKALVSGVAVAGANDTWYTGMLSFYAEMAAERGLVSIIASNASPWVAPYGATEGRLGTNPICFGFPSADEPIILDIGTSAIIHAEATLARRLGKELPEGVAFDQFGQPTRDPTSALAGAFATWGGYKGSGLAIAVQLLGAMAGSPPIPGELAGFGFLMIAMKPDLMGPAETFVQSVAEFANAVRSARPAPGGPPARMPFDRSRAERARRLREDAIEVADMIVSELRELAQRRS